jgi:hypothetical protein
MTQNSSTTERRPMWADMEAYVEKRWPHVQPLIERAVTISPRFGFTVIEMLIDLGLVDSVELDEAVGEVSS